MSTEINVTVDSGGLLERSKLQAAANRQAFVEGQQRANAEQTGKEQRSERLAKEGLDEQGNPLPTSQRSSAVDRYRQEPAARRRSGDEYFLLRPTAGVTDGAIPFLHKGLVASGSVSGALAPTYVPGAGPNGSAALVAPESALLNYATVRSEFPFAGSRSRFKAGVTDFTLQYYAKFSSTLLLGEARSDTAIRLGSSGYAEIIIGFEPRYRFGEFVGLYRTAEFTVRRAAQYSKVELYSTEQAYSGQATVNVSLDAYHHFAISKKGRAIKAFFDGVTIATADVEWDLMEFGADFTDAWLDANFGTSTFIGDTAPSVHLHGLRFDTKALYTTTFTPPLNL